MVGVVSLLVVVKEMAYRRVLPAASVEKLVSWLFVVSYQVLPLSFETMTLSEVPAGTSAVQLGRTLPTFVPVLK